MSRIEKMATRIAAEMVEAYLNHGATLDTDLIAEKSCEIAYKIHEQAKQYKNEKTLSKKDIQSMIEASKTKPIMTQNH